MISRVHYPSPEALADAIEALLSGADMVVSPAHPGANPIPEDAIPPGFVGVIVATSGSTGVPKSVMLSSAALRRAAELAHRRLGGPGRWVSALPVWYVAGLMTHVRAIVAGRDHEVLDPRLFGLRPAKDVAYLSLVPAQLHRALSDPTCSLALPTYSAVLVGGAGLDEGLRERAERAGVRIVTTYGMSETCGGVVYDGCPLDEVEVSIMEGSDEGRVVLTGPTTFSGYVGDPDMTATVLHGQSFLTSDRGRLVKGRLHITGRIDDVVQSGGVNVDLGRIQSLLDQAFGPVTACFAVPDPVWGSTIAVASTGPGHETIMARVGDDCDSPARPRIFIDIAEIPRTSSGKIDRRALVEQWRCRGERG